MKFDFLVIGSGSAGLRFALSVAHMGSVGIITKKNKTESNTNYAQGGIAVVWDKQDSFKDHIQDTLVAGAGLCKEKAVRLIVEGGPHMVRELMEMGAAFSRKKQDLDLGREGGHSKNRIIHAADTTGREIERALLEKVEEHPNIHVLEHHFAVELITQHHLGREVTRYDADIQCFGAYVFNIQEECVEVILAKVTVLATGGTGQIYQHTTNPEIATGDGIAMAFRAKARIANMEFIQFHPTSLCVAESDSFLISEAVRGAGAVLQDASGYAFMKDYDERKDLAPRDIVARAIDDQLKRKGDDCVFLDVTHLSKEEIMEHFPHIYSVCKMHGIDITTDRIPVVPAAHYTCGGIITDLDGRTNIHRLYACGEVACTGVHGANRLASNSLLEALVFADQSAKNAATLLKKVDFQTGIPDWDASGTKHTEEWVLISHNKRELQQTMTNYVGIVRSDFRLKRAFRRTHLLYEEVEDYFQKSSVSVPLCQLRNMIAVSYLVIRSALKRQESRGLHYTLDYLEPKEEERRDTII